MTVSSIRVKLVLILTLAFAALMLTSVYRAHERSAADTQHYLSGLEARADFIVEQQREAARRTEQMLSLVSSALNPAQLLADPECSARLAQLTDRVRYVSNIALMVSADNFPCSAHPIPSWVEPYAAQHFSQAAETSERVVFAPIQNPTNNRWQFVYGQRFPGPDGELAGVAVVTLGLQWIEQEFANQGADSPLRIGLITEQGILLTRVPDPGGLGGQNIQYTNAYKALLSVNGNGTAATISLDGIERVYVFRPFIETDEGEIYLYLAIPETVTSAAAEASFRMDTVVNAAVLLAVFCVVSLLIFRLIFMPLERIVDAAQRLRAGDPWARTGLPHTKHEVGRLAAAFDGMADQLTHFDPVTGLFNLPIFHERASAALADASRSNQSYAFIRMSVDNLRLIESKWGLTGVNHLLKQAARCLQRTVPDGALIGRLGEGGFVISLGDNATLLHVSTFIDSLQKALAREEFGVGTEKVALEVSFGVSFYPYDGTTSQELVQRCGIALGYVESKSGTRLRFYQHTMNESLLKRYRRTTELANAIERSELTLHYQPKLELASGRFVGVEALIRWQHPTEGLLAPAAFINLAEESGLIVPMGEWVIRRAIKQLDEWRRADPSACELTVAINVCGLQLASDSFLPTLASALAEVDLPADMLEIELTESQLMTASADPESLIHSIKALGVAIAIDDFGTGYSSLSYLKRFDVDSLKIDKSFVEGIPDNPGDVIIVQATIAMAHSLGLTVVAEGVEYAHQASLLKSLDCDQVQGYLISRPVPPERILAMTLDAGLYPSLSRTTR